MPSASAEPQPRALLYACYARLLGFPPPGLAEAWADGSLWDELRALHRAAAVPPPAPEPEGDPDGADLEAAYLATFEVGMPGPPVPLCESASRAPGTLAHRTLLEELVRFYEFFGLDLGSRLDELPDHLTAELEFVAALAEMEALAAGTDGSGEPRATAFSRATRDFLERHLAPLVHAVCAGPVDHPLYRAAFDSLRTVVEADLARLRGERGTGTGPRPGDRAARPEP